LVGWELCEGVPDLRLILGQQGGPLRVVFKPQLALTRGLRSGVWAERLTPSPFGLVVDQVAGDCEQIGGIAVKPVKMFGRARTNASATMSSAS
jgi:hypothetical protein